MSVDTLNPFFASLMGMTPPNLARSLFLVAFGGILLVLAVRRLRTYRLRERYALVFALLGLPFIALAFWPDGVGWIALRLNIQYNTLALIGVSCFLFLAVFELLSIVSVQDQKITALAQLVGILMEKQNLVEKEHRPGGADAREAAQLA
jgi:Uncharacterized conserved protein (DUF2304)